MFIISGNLQDQQEEDQIIEASVKNEDSHNPQQKRSNIQLPPITFKSQERSEQFILSFSQNQNSPKFEEMCTKTQSNPLVQQPSSSPLKSKSFQQMLIYFHLKTFSKKLLNLIHPEPNYTLHHQKIIGDLASNMKRSIRIHTIKKTLIHQYITLIDYRVQLRLKYRSFKNKFRHQFESYITRIPLIEPISNKKFIWDVITFIVRLYLIIMTPILISFNEIDLESNTPLIIASCFILIIDILLRSFTITYEQGQPVNDRKQLFRKQLNIYTYIELFSFIFTIILCWNSNQILELFVIGEGWPKLFIILLYLQIGNILEHMNNVQYSLKINKSKTSILDLLKLVGLILLIQHVCCCIWLIVGQLSNLYFSVSWLDQVNSSTWGHKYLESFYFISVTMFTVGYGDTLPTNSLEKIFCIFYMFLCTLQLSYTVSTIGTLLTQLKETNQQIQQKITAINEYMFNKKISYSLQYKVREYFNFYLKQEIIQQANEQSEIIKLLPDELQHSLKIEAAQLLLNKCSFFSQNFTYSTKAMLLEKLEFQTYQPSTFINNKSDFFIYIVEQGQVDLMQNKSKIASCKQYDYFGLQEFLTHQSTNIQYKTSAFTSLLTIPYQDFYNILLQNNADFELFQELQKNEKYSQNCVICDTNTHNSEACKLVHFVPDSERTIIKYLYDQNQERKSKFKRRKIKLRMPSIYSITEKAQEFTNENDELLEKIFPDLDDESEASGDEQNMSFTQEKQIAKGKLRLSKIIKPLLGTQIQKLQQINLKGKGGQTPLMLSCKQLPDPVFIDLKKKFENIDKFRIQEQNDIYFHYKMQENQQLSSENFERLHSYDFFSPKWNIDLIIKNIELNKMNKLGEHYQRFVKYMLSPWDFVNFNNVTKLSPQHDIKVKKKKKRQTKIKSKGSIHPE